MNLEKRPRNYFTPDGYRLATYEEARNGLQTIKEKSLLEEWETVRLLDGWISGPAYDFQMGNSFRGCMASMLVIKLDEQDEIASGTLYKDIIHRLKKNQKEVALLLCTEDWNYEVVYCVLNSLSGSETMDPSDVAQGNILFSDSAKFREMNTMMHDIARKFLEKRPPAEIAKKRKFSDPNSVREVLSAVIEFMKEKQQRTTELFSDAIKWDLETALDLRLENLTDVSLGSTWIGDIDSQLGATWEVVADAFWNFLSECFAFSMLNGYFATIGVIEICRFTNEWDRNAITSSQEDFIFASHVLLHMTHFVDEIIFSPLQENGEFNPAKTILCYASEKVEQQPEHLNNMLQANALGRCYEESGNYEVLDKLLIIASKGQNVLQRGRKVDFFVIKRLLECGAKPGRSLRSRNKKTALHYVAKLEDEKVAKYLLEKCDENQRENFINAQDDYGRTALHRATELGNRPLCELLLSYSARLDARDKWDGTVLGIAMRNGNEEITDLLAKSLRKLDEAEAYFGEVDLPQILRKSLLEGKVEIVSVILNKGEELPCDDDGKTLLHLATMCKNKLKAQKMVDLILDRTKDKEKAVAMPDRRGRTVLHEAALQGHASICRDLLDLNPNLISLKDQDGRNALYDAVQCQDNSMDVWQVIWGLYSKRETKWDDFIDRKGQTILHVAAGEDRSSIVEDLLTNQDMKKSFFRRRGAAKLGDRDSVDIIKRADFLGQTALHKAARSGDTRTVQTLLEKGANPFEERDCDGRTALHYVAQRAESGKGEGKELAELLLKHCKSDEEKLLFLWASAAGVGPADQNLSDDQNLRDDLNLFPRLRESILEKRKRVSEAKKRLSEEKKRLKEFISGEKKRLTETLSDGKPYNLLQVAASTGHTGMTKELLSRGFHIADIQNEDWKHELDSDKKENVTRVQEELKRVAEQGNDQPTIDDNLERRDYAHGLAALLLNPFLKPPITVGICGDWGKGKSSVMIQTERILLETVAQLAILPSPQLSRSTSDFPGVKVLQLSENGVKRAKAIKRQLDLRGGLFRDRTSEGQDADSLVDSISKFLTNYEPKYRDIFKALAVMDSTEMLSEEQTKIVAKERSVPAIITVQYNAWKYRNETEALAGLAVEITKEIEGSMTDPQWLTTCFRNAWRKQKHSIWINIIFPCLLAILVAGSFIWIVWLVFQRYKLEEWAKAKYACVPAAIVVVVWILAKSIMGVLKPVSTQLMNYISFPDHADKLGYQDRVISDINFLKDEIGKKPSTRCTAMVILWHLVITLWFAVLSSFSECFAALSSFPKCLRNTWTNMKCRPADFLKDENGRKRLKICSCMVKLWHLVFSLKLWFAILAFCRKCIGSVGTSMKFPPASSKDLRIIVFVDDLDRCQESVILQVLAAINLVLAVCEINVVLGMDKGLIERAIMKKHGDSKSKSSKLADNYLQKIIQLPLDLPDPSEMQLTKFLESHMGLKASVPDGKMSTEPNVSGTTTPSTDGEDQPQFHTIDMGTPREEREINVAGTEEGTRATESFTQPGAPTTSDEHKTEQPDHCGCSTIFQGIKGAKQNKTITPKQGAATTSAGQNTNKTGNKPISIREMLFVTYSAGEWDAICHFKKFATDCRKLPREWKRFLNYHRLVWNIFSINVAENPLVGWQVQLISWIFICWEWKENMDFLIQDWLNVGILKSLKSEDPSLGIIVEHFIEECGSNNENRKGKDEVKNGIADGKQTNTDNKMEQTSLQRDTDKKAEDPEGKESLLDQPEVEMRSIKEELHSLKKSVEELKNTINELKLGQMTKQVTPKNENRVDGSKIKRKDMTNWKRLRSALDKYDVTMDGIRAFQRFRFHCVPGHLQWPLPKQEWEVK